MEAHARVAAAIESTPYDAVVHLRVAGAVPATLTAAAPGGDGGGTHSNARGSQTADELRAMAR